MVPGTMRRGDERQGRQMTMTDSEESRISQSMPVLTNVAAPFGRSFRPSPEPLDAVRRFAGNVGVPLHPSVRTDEGRP